MTAMLSPPSSLACRPRYSSPRTDRATYGPKVAEVAEALGTPLMPWQQHVVDVALEVDERGRFVYDQVVLTVPRQAGKTTLLLAVMTWRSLAMERAQHITYAAQSGVAARDKLFDDYWPALEHSPLGTLFRARKTTGHEAFIAPNGSRITITAATEKAGHGGSLDMPMIDEAFAYGDARLEQALLPAMRARRRFAPGPQLWVVSTAGSGASTYLRGKVKKGRESAEAGLTAGTAYFEWSADPEADPTDPATWWSCIPSLGHSVDEDGIRAEFETYTDINEWKRAGLNQWVDALVEPVIPLDDWTALEDADSHLPGSVTFAVDVAPDRATAAIAAAGKRADGRWHVETVEHKSGTGWLLDRLIDLHAAHRGQVMVVPGSAAGSLIPDLEAAGVALTQMRTADVMAAFGMFVDACSNDQLRHLGQPSLTSALSGASRKDYAGGGAAWSRRSVSVDITPLIAATNALWGASQDTGPVDVDIYFI